MEISLDRVMCVGPKTEHAVTKTVRGKGFPACISNACTLHYVSAGQYEFNINGLLKKICCPI